MLGQVVAADSGEEASPSRGGGGLCLRQPAAEEWGVPLVPERRGHMHLLRPGGDAYLLEHDGKAPLLGQHAGDEVLHIGTGRRPPASSECVPEGPVRCDEAVALVQERSQGAWPAASSWSQLSCIGIAAGSAAAARSPGCSGSMGCGEPAPRGAHSGASEASPAGTEP